MSRGVLDAAPERSRTRLTVEWCEALDRALGRMDAAGRDDLLVVDRARPVGRISRAAIDEVRSLGNWLGSVAVVDVMRRPRRFAQRPRRLMM